MIVTRQMIEAMGKHTGVGFVWTNRAKWILSGEEQPSSGWIARAIGTELKGDRLDMYKTLNDIGPFADVE